MKNSARLLTPEAVNKALDKINAKSNPAPKYTVHWRSPVTRSWQSSAEKTMAGAQKTARQLIKEGARDVSISAFEDGRAVDVPIKENPARKTRAVRVVAANPKSSDKRLRKNRPVSNKKWLGFSVQEKRSEAGKWIHTAGFHKRADAEQYARSLHAIRPDMFFRVIEADS